MARADALPLWKQPARETPLRPDQQPPERVPPRALSDRCGWLQMRVRSASSRWRSVATAPPLFPVLPGPPPTERAAQSPVERPSVIPTARPDPLPPATTTHRPHCDQPQRPLPQLGQMTADTNPPLLSSVPAKPSSPPPQTPTPSAPSL